MLEAAFGEKEEEKGTRKAIRKGRGKGTGQGELSSGQGGGTVKDAQSECP